MAKTLRAKRQIKLRKRKQLDLDTYVYGVVRADHGLSNNENAVSEYKRIYDEYDDNTSYLVQMLNWGENQVSHGIHYLLFTYLSEYETT